MPLIVDGKSFDKERIVEIITQYPVKLKKNAIYKKNKKNNVNSQEPAIVDNEDPTVSS